MRNHIKKHIFQNKKLKTEELNQILTFIKDADKQKQTYYSHHHIKELEFSNDTILNDINW